MVVERFGPIGGQVLAVAVGSLTVVEGHPFGGPQRQFGGTGIERLAVDEFGLVAAVHRFGRDTATKVIDLPESAAINPPKPAEQETETEAA